MQRPEKAASSGTAEASRVQSLGPGWRRPPPGYTNRVTASALGPWDSGIRPDGRSRGRNPSTGDSAAAGDRRPVEVNPIDTPQPLECETWLGLRAEPLCREEDFTEIYRDGELMANDN